MFKSFWKISSIKLFVYLIFLNMRSIDITVQTFITTMKTTRSCTEKKKQRSFQFYCIKFNIFLKFKTCFHAHKKNNSWMGSLGIIILVIESIKKTK